MYTGKAAYSVLIFLVYKNAIVQRKSFIVKMNGLGSIKMLQEDGKSSKLSCLFCSFAEKSIIYFFCKKVLFCILAEISGKYEWNSL